MTSGKPPFSDDRAVDDSTSVPDPDMEILFRRVAGQPRPADSDKVARPSPPSPRASQIRLSPRRRRLDREQIAALVVLVLALTAFLAGALASTARSDVPASRVVTRSQAEASRAVAASSASNAIPTRPERREPLTAPAPSPAGTRDAAVRAFYDALGRGDGETASALVVAEKRSTKAFSPQAISRFYGGLSEPLRLTALSPLEDGAFRVSYHYSAGRSRCDGGAVVSLTTRNGRELIRSIRALNNC